MMLTRRSCLVMVAPVETARGLLEVRVHYPGYFGTLALKNTGTRKKKRKGVAAGGEGGKSQRRVARGNRDTRLVETH